jgi:hypothetical protein
MLIKNRIDSLYEVVIIQNGFKWIYPVQIPTVGLVEGNRLKSFRIAYVNNMSTISFDVIVEKYLHSTLCCIAINGSL